MEYITQVTWRHTTKLCNICLVIIHRKVEKYINVPHYAAMRASKLTYSKRKIKDYSYRKLFIKEEKKNSATTKQERVNERRIQYLISTRCLWDGSKENHDILLIIQYLINSRSFLDGRKGKHIIILIVRYRRCPDNQNSHYHSLSVKCFRPTHHLVRNKTTHFYVCVYLNLYFKITHTMNYYIDKTFYAHDIVVPQQQQQPLILIHHEESP